MGVGLVTTKVCNVCQDTKTLENFVPHKECKLGRSNICRLCKNERQRLYRVDNNNEKTRSYEKTVNGYLMRTYRNMKSRVTGVLKKKRHLYEGLPILEKEEFYRWSNSSNFIELFTQYKESGWLFKLAPSIDRVDSSRGYTVDNIRWLTLSQNSARVFNTRGTKP